METTRLQSKKAADVQAVRVFADNIRELLMAAPLGQKPVLASGSGFCMGCKLVILDAQGALLFDSVIYATTGSPSQPNEAENWSDGAWNNSTFRPLPLVMGRQP